MRTLGYFSKDASKNPLLKEGEVELVESIEENYKFSDSEIDESNSSTDSNSSQNASDDSETEVINQNLFEAKPKETKVDEK